MSGDVHTRFLAAMVFARAHKDERAKAVFEKLNEDYPAGTMIQSYWLPAIRAAIELNRGNANQALQLLQQPISYEWSIAPPWSALYPTYLRGQAFLQTHQGQAAAAEFQKMLDHRSLNLTITGSLAYLYLGRAQAMSGETSKAATTYGTFFALWKDADSDLPILTEARAEYARMSKNVLPVQ